MEMTWAQTLTIVVSMAGVSFWIWRVSEKNADNIRKNMEKDAERHAAEIKRHDTEFQETRQLWASLLHESKEIEKEKLIVQQEIRDIKNKSYGVEQEIRDIKSKSYMVEQEILDIKSKSYIIEQEIRDLIKNL